jgi:hypothetical protein
MEESTEFFTEKYIATVFSCPKKAYFDYLHVVYTN